MFKDDKRVPVWVKRSQQQQLVICVEQRGGGAAKHPNNFERQRLGGCVDAATGKRLKKKKVHRLRSAYS